MTRVAVSECAAMISKLLAALERSVGSDDFDRETDVAIEDAKAMLEKIRHEP